MNSQAPIEAVGRDVGTLRPTLALGAIFRNEGPYILEWIAYHRALGVERFFIADNASDDGSTALLAALDRAGIIRHIPFPDRPGKPPQLPAYAEILHRHGGEADWIAFIDADEFLLPQMPLSTLADTLVAIDQKPDVGAIAVNWAIYGSAASAEAHPDPVIERFQRRAPRSAPMNRHYKSIVRTAACLDVGSTPHHFRLRPGFRVVYPDGHELVLFDPRRPGLSRGVHWGPLRLNHYVVKSREEFFERKRSRGRATRSDSFRDAAFFDTHDRNEEHAPMPRALLDAARHGTERIRQELLAFGWSGEEPPLRPGKAPIILPATPPAHPKATTSHGRIDKVEPLGQVIQVRGWAVPAGGGRMAGFLLLAGDQPIDPIETSRRARPDVVARFPAAHPSAGFALTAAAEDLPAGPLTLRAIAADGGVLDLPLPQTAGRRCPEAIVVPEMPMLSPDSAAAFRDAVARARSYIEYGSGGSTVLAVNSGIPELVSIESDRVWHAAVHRQVAGRLRPGRHHLNHVDIGPTSRFGYPATDVPWRRFPQYALAPWQLNRPREADPDLVLIDGRFRVACLLATLIHASPGCRVLFDDYEGRSAYRRVTDFVQPRRLIDRMAEFIVPESRRLDTLWPALIEALGDPL